MYGEEGGLRRLEKTKAPAVNFHSRRNLIWDWETRKLLGSHGDLTVHKVHSKAQFGAQIAELEVVVAAAGCIGEQDGGQIHSLAVHGGGSKAALEGLVAGEVRFQLIAGGGVSLSLIHI